MPKSKKSKRDNGGRPPSSSATQLFPPDCIFCGRHNKVNVSGKTERCIKFPVFKDKDEALKEELERNGFPNPEYRSEKLKAKVEAHDIHERIAFAKVNPGDKGCITYNLVYNATISVPDVVTYAYKLASKDKYEYEALLLRGIIQQIFNESKSLPWPPTADDLEVKSSDELLLLDLMKFLNPII
eukprot:superscaffoldBa00000322_g3792